MQPAAVENVVDEVAAIDGNVFVASLSSVLSNNAQRYLFCQNVGMDTAEVAAVDADAGVPAQPKPRRHHQRG